MTKLLFILAISICFSSTMGEPSSNENQAELVPFIINNSGSGNNNNKVNNGNDALDGNLINGNENGDNLNSGNVLKSRPELFIINNSGNNNSENVISNGDDDVDGNLINGNSNGNNSNSGNVDKHHSRPIITPFIINNSGSNNNNNSLANGNDDVDGNLVNGNGNGDNSNSGNIDQSGNLQTTTSRAEKLSLPESANKLLDRIDVLLELILQRLANIRIMINVPFSIELLLEQVRDTLVNVLRNLFNTLNQLQSKNDLVKVSNLIRKLDAIKSLYQDKIIKLPELIIPLRNILNSKTDIELELLPGLLQRVLQLLEKLN